MSRLDKDQYFDGILLLDEKDQKKRMVFNGHTFIEILKGIIVKYADKSDEEAYSIILNSKFLKDPILDYDDGIFFSHELEYHWAMLMTLGSGYWLVDGITEKLPDDYFNWEEAYIKENGLRAESFEFP